MSTASIDRRHLLAGAAVAGIATGAGLPALPAAAQGAAPAQAPGFYRYKVGDIVVTAIHEGVASRPIEGFVRNAPLDAVKQAMADAFLSTETLPNTFTSLVVQTGGRTVLIDTGFGEFAPPTAGRWMANFRAAGFDPAQVNTIVISHFHGDHIGGVRKRDGSLTFPNAEIMVPAAEMAFWLSEERMAAAPEAMRGGFQNARRVFAPIASTVTRFEAGKEVAPGVTAIAAHGHAPGHTVFMIQSGQAKLLSLADTANHPALFVRNPDWSAIFDMNADEARATRRRLLDMAASERTQVAFYHAPFPATGFIAREGSGYRLVPVQWSDAV